MRLCLLLLALCTYGLRTRPCTRRYLTGEHHTVEEEGGLTLEEEGGPTRARVRHWMEPGLNGKYFIVEEPVGSLVDWASRFHSNPKQVLRKLQKRGVLFLDMTSALTDFDQFIQEARKITDASIWFNLPEETSGSDIDVQIEDPSLTSSSPGVSGADLSVLTEGVNQIWRLLQKDGHLFWDEDVFGSMARITSRLRQSNYNGNGTFYWHLEDHRHMRLAWVLQGEASIFIRSKKGVSNFSEVHAICDAQPPEDTWGFAEMLGCDSPQEYQDLVNRGWEVVQLDPDPRFAALFWYHDWMTAVPHRAPFKEAEKTNVKGNGRIYSDFDFSVVNEYVPDCSASGKIAHG